jgi:hypothetical protein
MNSTEVAPWRSHWILTVGPSALLFVGSLALPAFHSGGAGEPRAATSGLTALAVGWFPALFGLLGGVRGDMTFVGTIAWFANPLLLVSWACVGSGRRGGGATLAGLAVLASLIFGVCRIIPVPDNQTLSHITPGAGYPVWIASMVVVIVGALFARRGTA